MHPAAPALNAPSTQHLNPAGGAPNTPANPLPAPLPEHDSAPLADQLHAAVQADPALQEAATAIERLARDEPLPESMDDARCQQAAQLLLQLRRAGLLGQLAQARPMAYVLRVGASEPHARVLADIGPHWPRDAPVLLVLSTALPREACASLHAFLMQPATLNVQIVAEEAQSPEATLAMAQALLLRKLKGLSITGAPLKAEVLRALAGTEAQALHLKSAPSQQEPRDAGLDAAWVALVRQSGAAMLHLDDTTFDGPLAAAMLCCRPDWQTVHLGLSLSVYQLLLKGVVQIHTLGLHIPRQLASPNPGFLKRLHASGVNTLVVHGAMDLARLASSLEAHSTVQGRYVHRIEACFLVPVGADVEAILDTLARNHRVDVLCHKPMALSRSGHALLGEDAVARLTAMGAAKQAALSVHIAPPPPADWQDAVLTIAGLLAPDRTARDVIGYLNAPDNRLIPTVDLSTMALRHHLDGASLRDKLAAFLAAEVSHELLRAAIACCLYDHPGLGREMCHALIQARFATAPRRDDWHRVASRHALPPISEGVDPNTLDRIAPSAEPAQPASAKDQPPARSGRARFRNVVDAIPVVTPSTAVGLAQLLHRLRAQEDQLRREPHRVAACAAVVAIIGLLESRTVNFTRMTHAVLTEFANELLNQGQGRLLGHLVPHHSFWIVHVTTPAMALALAQMERWPEPQSACYLTVSSELPDTAVEKLATFVKTVAPKSLHLRVWLRPMGEATVWNRLVDMVRTRPGLELTLESPLGVPFPSDDTLGFLKRIPDAHIRHLVLVQLPEDDAPVFQALSDTMQTAGVDSLGLSGCSASSMRHVLPCRHWDRLHLVVSPELPQQLQEGMATANFLYLNVPRGCAQDIRSRHLETIVGAIGALKELDIGGVPVDIRVLADILRQKRSIHTVRCVPAMHNRQEAKAAIALMRQNPSILRFEFIDAGTPFDTHGLRPLDPDIRKGLLDLVARHRLRDSRRLAGGAAKGFGWSLGDGGKFVDPLEAMGSHLDPTSAMALALTTKAAYAAAMRPRHERVAELAALLAPATPFKTVQRTLRAWIASGVLAGHVPRAATHPLRPRNLMLNTVMAMQSAGLPDDVIGEAIRHRLHQLTQAPGPLTPPGDADLATTPFLLEALAHVGAMPTLQWLREGLGISPQVTGTNPVEAHA